MRFRMQPGCCDQVCNDCECGDCIDCECCIDNIRPRQVSVTVPPMHYIGFPYPQCNCHDYAGEYIMDVGQGQQDILDYCFPPGTNCWWKSDFDILCGRSRAHLVMGCSSEAVEIQFSLMPTDCRGAGQWLRWWKVFNIPSDDFDCCFNNLEIPWALFGPGNIQCEPDGLAPVVLSGINCANCSGESDPCSVDTPLDWRPDFLVTIPTMVSAGNIFHPCDRCGDMDGTFLFTWNPVLGYRVNIGPFCDDGRGPMTGWFFEISLLQCNAGNIIKYTFQLSPLSNPNFPRWGVTGNMPVINFMAALNGAGIPMTDVVSFAPQCSLLITGAPAIIKLA